MKQKIKILSFLVLFWVTNSLFAQQQQLTYKTFIYDVQNQLETVVYGNGVSVTFGYDRNHNRIFRNIFAITPNSYISIGTYGSSLPSAEVFVRMQSDSLDRFVGLTDENGMLHTPYLQSLGDGDTLVVRAAGYQEMRIPLSDELIEEERRLPIPMIQRRDYASLLQVLKPAMKVNSSQGVLSNSPTIELELSGENVQTYQAFINEVWTNVPSTFTYTLPVKDYNLLRVRFISTVDTVELQKPFYYLLPSDTALTMSLEITTQNDFLGTQVWANNQKLATINSTTSNFLLRREANFLKFIKNGYRDSLFIVETDSAIAFSLIPLPLEADSTVLYPNQFMFQPDYWYKQNTTLFSSGLDSVKIYRDFRSLDSIGMIRDSPFYEVNKLVLGSLDSLSFRTIFDIINYPSSYGTFLLLYENGLKRKIYSNAFALDSIQYDSASQLLKLHYLSKQKTAFVLNEKQAAIPLAHTFGLDTLDILQGHFLEVNYSSRYLDPDSMASYITRNDTINDRPELFEAIYDTTQLVWQQTETGMRLAARDCQFGTFQLIQKVRHDSLVISDTIVVNVAPIDSVGKLWVLTSPACQGQIVATIPNTKLNLDYRLVNVGIDTALTPFTAGTGNNLNLIFEATQSIAQIKVQVIDSLSADTCIIDLDLIKSLVILPKPDTLSIPRIISCFGVKDSVQLMQHTTLIFDEAGTQIDSVGTNGFFVPPHNELVAGLYTYKAVTFNSFMCPSDTFSIEIEQNPSLVNLPQSLIVCELDSVILYPTTIQTTDTLKYKYWRNGTLLSDSTNTYRERATTTFTLITEVTNTRTLCIQLDTISIEVTPKITNNNFAINYPQHCSVDSTNILVTGTTPLGGTGTYQFFYQTSIDTTNINNYRNVGIEKDLNLGILYDTLWVRRKVVSGECENFTAFKPIYYIPTPTIKVFIADSLMRGDSLFICDKFSSVPVRFEYGYGNGQLFVKNQDGTYRLINTSRNFVLGATGNYRYVSNFEGCKDTVDFKIQRGLPFVHDIQPVNPHFCKFITLKSFPTPNNADATKEWFERTPNGDMSLGEGENVTLLDSANVFLVTTAYNGCADTSNFVQVYKLPVNEAFIFGSPEIRLCDNEPLNLRSNYPAYWYLLDGNRRIQLSPDKIAEIGLGGQVQGKFIAEVISYDSCITYDTVQVIRDINREPKLQGLSAIPSVICSDGSDIVLTGNCQNCILEITNQTDTTSTRISLGRNQSYTLDVSTFEKGKRFSISYGYPFVSGCYTDAWVDQFKSFYIPPAETKPVLSGLKDFERFCIDADSVLITGTDSTFGKELTLYKEIKVKENPLELDTIPIAVYSDFNILDTTYMYAEYLDKGNYFYKYSFNYDNECRRVDNSTIYRFEIINDTLEIDTTQRYLYANLRVNDSLRQQIDGLENYEATVWYFNGEIIAGSQNKLELEIPDENGELVARYENKGCFVYDTIQVYQEEECFVIYPNPTSEGFVNVRICGRKYNGKIQVRLIDDIGREIEVFEGLEKNEKTYEHRFNIPKLAAGTYILQFEFENTGTEIKRFVVE